VSGRVSDAPWKAQVGGTRHEPPFVHAEERADKDGRVYLRWWSDTAGNWKRRATAITLRTRDGKLVKSRIAQAEQAARQVREDLLAGLLEAPVAVPAETAHGPVTLRDALTLAFDHERGKYKPDERGKLSAHAREVQRSLRHAIRVLGGDAAMEAMAPEDLSALWTDRIRALHKAGKNGHRPAVIVVRDLLAVASWLRANRRIPANACLFDSRAWKADLQAEWQHLTGRDRDHEPNRPRHTLEEMRATLKAAHRVDPRLALELALGAELRLAQVVRGRRKDLVLVPTTEAPFGRFTVYGKRGKKGTVVHLTRGQRATVDRTLAVGYLRLLEAAHQTGQLDDYPLFPAGQLKGTRRHTVTTDALPSADLALPTHRLTRHAGEPVFAARAQAMAARIAAGETLSEIGDHFGIGPEQVAKELQRHGHLGPRRHALAPTPWAGYCTLARHADARPIDAKRMRELFHAAERKAQVPVMPGRAGYGIRRVTVDAANDEDVVGVEIGAEALQELGGWVDGQVPATIYRDKERGKARAKAARVRAQIRGEEE
jgi:hypothetical protein